jgi:hypothetical protein
MGKTVRQKLNDKLEEYKKFKYFGSFICKDCQMYNEYIGGNPVIIDNDIMIEYKCHNCGKNHYANE